MANTDMLDTNFLFQPRGQGTGWCFRMVTPLSLIGRDNPRTGRPYSGEIREGLKTRDLKLARKLRDLRLGAIRLEEAEARNDADGSLQQALTIAENLKSINDTDHRNVIDMALLEKVERLVPRKKRGSWGWWHGTFPWGPHQQNPRAR